MNISRIWVCALASAGLLSYPTAWAADGNWLIGGSVGYARVDETIATLSFNTDSTSFRFYGGYQFSDYFTVEFGYLDLGDFDEQFNFGGGVSVSAEADGFTLGASGHIPLGERFSIHGSIGSFFWDGETSINGISDDPGDTNLFLGAGVKYSLTSNLSLRADAGHYDLEDVDVNVFTLGLQIDFN